VYKWIITAINNTIDEIIFCIVSKHFVFNVDKIKYSNTPKLNTFSREGKKMLKTEAPKDAKPASIEEIDKSIEELVA
jgi:hypothetical protein